MAMLTLTDLIHNQTEFNIRNVSIFSATEDIIYIDYTLYNKYANLLQRFVVECETEETDRTKYNYRPGLLSQLLYGTTELDTLILQLNDAESPSDFRMKKIIKLIKIEDIKYFFDTIVLQNKETLEKNKIEVGL